ncbi:MAG: beta-galactosidase [Verrucomicrobia bacterium]|nr:beta-galactosidase [Verrucomicrobiota bacterium]
MTPVSRDAKLTRFQVASMTTGACIVFLLGFASALCAQPNGIPKGVYVLIPTEEKADARILRHPHVAGLQIRARWSTIEPSNNAFDWNYFDDLIAKARANNKKISIAIARGLAGKGLPAWLSTAMFTGTNGTKGPVPWDPVYQKEWNELWVALARRYESEPVVSMHHIGGIYSWDTADWDLCDATLADRKKWLATGYQIEKIQAFALRFFEALSKETRKPLILPIAGTMNNQGEVNTDIATDDFIIKPLFERYGPKGTGQFCIMRTTFQETTPDPLGIWNRSPLGGQYGTLYKWKPYTAGQREGKDPFTLDGLRKMLDISLHYEIRFMELGVQQILMPGIEGDLSRYDQSLGVPGSHGIHPSKP